MSLRRFGKFAALASLSAATQAPAPAQTLLRNYAFNLDATDSAGSANGTLIGGANISGGSLNLDGINSFAQFTTKIVPSSGSYSVVLSAQETGRQGNYVEFISQGYSGGRDFTWARIPRALFAPATTGFLPASRFRRMGAGISMP